MLFNTVPTKIFFY